MASVLERVARTVRTRTILVVVCDEYAVDDRLSAALRRAVAQHEVLLLTIGDLDPTGRSGTALTDIDSGGTLPAWASGDRRLAREYAEAMVADEADLRRTLDRIGIAHQHVADHDSAVTSVFRLLERHRHARRR